MSAHHENCDVNDCNPDGIKKPCNCGATGRSLGASAGSPAPSHHQELLQAAQDFVWNVEHHNVEGWGEVHVSTDTSFHILKHALRKAQENEKLCDGSEPSQTTETKQT